MTSQPGQEVGIEPREILQSIGGGIRRGQAEPEGRVAERQIEVDEQCFLLDSLAIRDGEIGGQRGDPGAALGSKEHKQLAIGLVGTPECGWTCAARTAAPSLRPWHPARTAG